MRRCPEEPESELDFTDTGDSSMCLPPMPRCRVAVMRGGKKVWLPWMEGMRDTGGSGETFAGEAGVPIVDVQFSKGSLGPKGCFRKNMSGGRLIGLIVYYDTPAPKRFGCHTYVHRPVNRQYFASPRIAGPRAGFPHLRAWAASVSSNRG